jgi:hypothetical protein
MKTSIRESVQSFRISFVMGQSKWFIAKRKNFGMHLAIDW